MAKFRRKNYVVEAMQATDGDWVIVDGEGKDSVYSDKDFKSLFEEVSPLHRVAPMQVTFEKGSEVLKGESK